MTDPKSISRNQEHYTEQYGVEPLNRRNQTTGASYESAISDTVDLEGNSVPDEYQEFFSDLPTESSEAGSDDSQLMEGFNEQVNGSIPPGTAPIEWDSTQLLAGIDDVLSDRENRALLEEAEAYDQFNDKYKELLRNSRHAGTNPEELMGQVEELKDNITSALEEIQSNNGEKYDSAIRNLESLVSRVEDSRLPSAEKTELTDRLEQKIDDLKTGKRDNDVFGEEAKEEIEDLQKEIGRSIGVHGLKTGFDDAVTRIPARGHVWEKSVELGRRIRDAVESDNWTSVSSYLRELHENDANNVVQQFVGSLFYGPAGKDEAKLSQYLALIPENVRDEMASAALRNVGERLSGENIDTDAHKEEHAYYGNPTVTADRLGRNDIDDALDSLGDSPAASA